MKEVYFPSLNGIRFIAAFMVLLDHHELFKGYFGYNTLWSEQFSSYLGSLGVTIFFVLSGFLITFLLMKEKEEIGTIQLKNFYLRRILRIWPLYYLIAIISFFVIPHIGIMNVPIYSNDINIYFKERLMLFLFFMPNVAFVYFPTLAFGDMLWSIGVEEQFYILWPNLVKKFKNTFKIIFIALFILYIIKLIILINPFHIINSNNYIPISQFVGRTRFFCMMIGALGALMLYYKKELLKIYVYNKLSQIILWIIFIFIIFNKINLPGYRYISEEFMSIVIISLILNMSQNKYSFVKLENKIVNYLGKISYGMYVYHLIAITFSLLILSKLYQKEGILNYIFNILTIILSIVLTIFISHFSYKYFEKPFLLKKKKFSSLISGDLTKEKD